MDDHDRELLKLFEGGVKEVDIFDLCALGNPDEFNHHFREAGHAVVMFLQGISLKEVWLAAPRASGGNAGFQHLGQAVPEDRNAFTGDPQAGARCVAAGPVAQFLFDELGEADFCEPAASRGVVERVTQKCRLWVREPPSMAGDDITQLRNLLAGVPDEGLDLVCREVITAIGHRQCPWIFQVAMAKERRLGKSDDGCGTLLGHEVEELKPEDAC